MKKLNLLTIIIGLNIGMSSCSDDNNIPVIEQDKAFTMPEKACVIAEQSRRAVVIRDMEINENVWNWEPYSACIPSAHQNWFKNPSEVKPVYNKKYILMTASGGAVALIRVSDKKMMYYANCGSNPHSAEILPDGNIVTAESRSGEINTFVTDTVKVFGIKSNTVKIGNAHNLVWDKKRSCLYATGTISSGVTALFRFNYNGDRNNPKLTNQQRIYTFEKESGGHDLFPVFDENDKLWFTAASAVYKFDLSTETPTCEKIYDYEDIKSVCNGPNGVMMLKPTEDYWAEGLINDKNEEYFKLKGSMIYKGRWIEDNLFSYPENHEFILGE